MEIDTHTLTMQILRWLHLIAGIIWIGHLYFFNFVNANFAKTMDAETKKKVVPELMPRALYWFRWGAMFTFLTGWLYIIWKLWIASDEGFMGDAGLMKSSWGQWISLGALFGTVMWFNVWFIIWPAQKKIINGIKTGTPADAKLVAKATMASKINTFLSLPLLFAMGAASHFPFSTWWIMLIVVGVGFMAAHHLIKHGTKVKTEV